MGKAIFTVFDNSMYLPSINYSIEKVVKNRSLLHKKLLVLP